MGFGRLLELGLASREGAGLLGVPGLQQDNLGLVLGLALELDAADCGHDVVFALGLGGL